MKALPSAPGSGNRSMARAKSSLRKDRAKIISASERASARLLEPTTLCLICSCAFGQTTRTSPSSASTSKSIPAASSTSPNSPCSNTNPTSPCYSANAPRNPCFNALAPDEPCSTTTTPNPQTAPPQSAPAAAITSQAISRAFTADQAKSQIEAEGYSKVSGLKKDDKGIWQGKAVKDGLPANVTLDTAGKVTAK